MYCPSDSTAVLKWTADILEAVPVQSSDTDFTCCESLGKVGQSDAALSQSISYGKSMYARLDEATASWS